MTAPSPPPEYDDLKRHDMPIPNAVYHPPPQQQQQMPQPQQPTAPPQNVQVAAVFQVLPHVGRDSTTIVCPMCKATVSTQVRYTNGTFTYVMSFLCGLFFLCCCIPLCFNGFKDAHHYCPKCNAFIGKDKRM
uniref:LITAF domain-containing protein n=1 Tax=Panagrellus redivivus TaxID=6233 RepID=A0A7E4W3M9_PANRE